MGRVVGSGQFAAGAVRLAFGPPPNPDENLNQDLKRHLGAATDQPTDKDRAFLDRAKESADRSEQAGLSSPPTSPSQTVTYAAA